MYVNRVLADKPYGFWSLDATSPFPDISGNANNATASGTYKYANTLVAGGGRSLVVNSAYVPSFSFPLLKTGYETRAWSWEIWFHPLQATHAISILKHGTAELSYTGTAINFIMTFADASTCVLKYTVLTRESMHVVVTHTANKIALFVNGVMVSSDEVDDSQNLAGYSAGTTTITSGNGTTDQILIDSVAFYGYDLSPAKIRTHFSFGRDVMTVADVVLQNLGYYYEPNDSASDVYMRMAWETDQDFNTSPLSDVRISNGLKPGLDANGNPIASSWILPINMNAISTTTVEFVRIGWVSTGIVTVQLRTDGVSWVTVSNNVAINLSTLDVTNAIFEIRVTFDGTDANAELDYLDFVVYKTTAIRGSINPRIVTYSGVVTLARETNEPIEQNLKRGADISAGGSVYASPDQEVTTPINAKTLDVWANFNSAAAFTIFDMRSVGNTTRPYLAWNGTALVSQGINKLYVNGVLTTIGTWTPTSLSSILFTIVLTTPANYGTYFGSPYTGTFNTNGQIESFAFYDTEPTATNLLRMYNSYYGIVTDITDDVNTIGVTEASDAYEIYTYAWSITGAG